MVVDQRSRVGDVFVPLAHCYAALGGYFVWGIALEFVPLDAVVGDGNFCDFVCGDCVILDTERKMDFVA
jgi:hypothetical protein